MGLVNHARGDVPIKFKKTQFILRPTFQAIVQIEEHFKAGIIDVARDYHHGKITAARDFVAIMSAGIAASEHDVPNDIGEQMIEAGLTTVIEPLGLFLAHACGLRG